VCVLVVKTWKTRWAAANVLISGVMDRFGGNTVGLQRGSIRFLVQNRGRFPPWVIRGPNNIAKVNLARQMRAAREGWQPAASRMPIPGTGRLPGASEN
jgi:hypothetical protein